MLNDTESAESKINRRLSRAISHVNTYWMPVNVSLYNKIRHGLQDGTYDLGIEFLLEDLKKDLSLLMYCFRELSIMLQNEGIPIRLEDPLEFLTFAGIKRITHIFKTEGSQLSHHNLDTIDSTQAAQLDIAFSSATATEVLAEHWGMATQPAFFAAMLRQLGRTLICFNYPTVFRRAIQQQSDERTLDLILSDLLGFSPAMLAVKMLQEWNLGSTLSSALQRPTPPSTTDEQDEDETMYVAQLCQVGEALAQANHPEIHSTSANDWNFAKEKIESALGREGLARISKRAKDYCSAYKESNPKMFTSAGNLDPEKRIYQHLEKDLLSSNQYAQACNAQLKKRFKDFYALVYQKSTAKESVAFLVREILPLCDFSAAVVYTMDTDQNMLVPRLKISAPKLRTLDAVSHNIEQNPNDVVTAAFNCTAPLHGYDVNQLCSYAAGKLGRTNNMGVFYIESAGDHSGNDDYLLRFKACREALHDALHLY